MKEIFKKYKIDIVVICVLLIASLSGVISFMCLGNSKGQIASIYVQEKLEYEIDLSKEKETPRQIVVNGKHGEVKIEVKLDDIRIIESTCLNKSCIHQGKATSMKPIICAYNEVYIELSGSKSTDVEL